MQVNHNTGDNSGQTVEECIFRLKEIISNELDMNLTTQDINEDMPLLENGLALDSVVLVEFISLIEHYFRVEFSEDDLQLSSFKNLKALAQHITSCMKGDRH